MKAAYIKKMMLADLGICNVENYKIFEDEFFKRQFLIKIYIAI